MSATAIDEEKKAAFQSAVVMTVLEGHWLDGDAFGALQHGETTVKTDRLIGKNSTRSCACVSVYTCVNMSMFSGLIGHYHNKGSLFLCVTWVSLFTQYLVTKCVCVCIIVFATC